MKLIAVLAYRNEQKYLPSFISHLQDHVDGLIALDDGSTDGSKDIIAACPYIIESLSEINPTEIHSKLSEHRKLLLEKAFEHKADWVLCCDADERYEENFLNEIRWYMHDRVRINLRVRDLWDEPDQYRIDGIWGEKSKVVMFPLTQITRYHGPGMHKPWEPFDIISYPIIPVNRNIYHLRSISRKDREDRMNKFKSLDPTNYFQNMGYDYLCDEKDLAVSKIDSYRKYK